MKVIVQIPCFNEEGVLAATIGAIPREIAGVDAVEILVVDDGSTDSTSEVARRCGVEHIVRHKLNRGLAAAYATGVDVSLRLGADVIVNTDADGQYPGEEIPRLLSPILVGNADIVVGDRQTWGCKHFRLEKRLLQRFGSAIVSLLAGQHFPDAVSGFRAISREAALRIHVVTSFSYTIETLLQAADKGLSVVFVSIYTHKTSRASRLFSNVPQFVLLSASTLLRVHAMFHPLMHFIVAGLLLVAIGLIPIARFLYLFSLGTGDGHVQSLLLGSVLFLVGIIVLSFGAVADLISFNRRLLEATLEKVKRIELSVNGNTNDDWQVQCEQCNETVSLARSNLKPRGD